MAGSANTARGSSATSRLGPAVLQGRSEGGVRGRYHVNRDLKERRRRLPPGVAVGPLLAPIADTDSPIDVARVAQHWDKLLRVTTSIRSGTVTAPAMLGTLSAYPRVGQAGGGDGPDEPARELDLSPSAALWSLRRMRSIAAGSSQSLNGAPFLSAPGLRASTCP